MKITPKQYALGLYEMIGEADASGIDDILKNFVIFLSKNNDLRLADKIIFEFAKIWDDKQGLAKVEVISANKLDKEVIDSLNAHITKWLDKKEITTEEKIDKNILGGIILKYRDMVVDGSLRKRITHLKQDLEK